MMESIEGNSGPVGGADVQQEQLAMARYMLAQYRAPRRDVSTALQSGSTDAALLTKLGYDCAKIQEYEWAVEPFQKALAGDPTSYWAGVGLAECYRELGQLDKAADIYETLYRNGHKTALLLQILSELPKSLTKVDVLSALETQGDLDAPDWQRAYIKANALDKAGRHSEAWAQFAVYNDLKRKLLTRDFPVRAESFAEDVALVKQRCSRALPGRNVEKDLPCSLFIVGPSRAGRTTLEALLGTLPGVKRGFESNLTTHILQALRAAGLMSGRRFHAMAPAMHGIYRRLYAEELAERTTEPVFVNTRPNLILDAYEIAGIVPNARFVFVKRDTDDNALRIYMKDYDDVVGHSYSYAIDSTFDFVCSINDTIDHLAALLPDMSRVIRYEDLVADPKAAVDSVADLCGLPARAGPLPRLGDDRGCAEPYKDFMKAAMRGGSMGPSRERHRAADQADRPPIQTPDLAAPSTVAAPPERINALRALHSQRRFEEMLERGGALAEEYPADHVVHFLVGSAYVRVGKPDEAIASYSKALAIKPDFLLAHSGLCALYDKLNRVDDLANALDRVGQLGLQGDPQMLVLSAKLLSREKNFEETLATLNNVAVEELPLSIQKEFHALLGKTYDKLGRFDEAFAQFERQNDLAKRDLYRRRIDPMSAFNRTVQLTEVWSSERNADWSATPEGADDISLAFLVGFPRSGTTLLDTILRSHPAVVVVEEKPMLAKMRHELGRTASIETINKLTAATLSSADIGRLRKTYFDELSCHIAPSDMNKLAIDKFPLNIRYAGLMHRVFPEAKFILALRHPCDSVLSCFMQNFSLNAAMANFLSLDQSARFYAAVMELWRTYRNVLELDVCCVKYEDLVRDLRGTCMPLIEFLGLEWDDNLLNYRETARKRDLIRTPSYDQVVQPLYDQASGRWQNYREQMTPVLPLLEPWIREFGYSTSRESSGDENPADRN